MTDSSSAHESRSRIRETVERASGPLTVEQIAERTDLHANTVRAHLDVLLATEHVVREPAAPGGRGRPRWLYSAARAAKPSPYQFLAEALAVQLGRGADPGLAEAAADRWAHAVPDLPKAATPDEAVAEATDALNRLGFIAEINAPGDSIAVTGCPYADLVDDSPVICDIHAALVARLLEQADQPVTVDSVDVWARRGMCVVHLNRPDLEPARRITVGPRGTVTASEGKAS